MRIRDWSSDVCSSDLRATKLEDNSAIYLKRRYRFWKSRDVVGEYRAGNFVEDARGRWYVVFQCEVADDLPAGTGVVGIDLGLKDRKSVVEGQMGSVLVDVGGRRIITKKKKKKK